MIIRKLDRKSGTWVDRIKIINGQRSTVDSRIVVRPCLDPNLKSFLVIDHNRLRSVFVNGPQLTVDSRSVVPHRLASILSTWYMVLSTSFLSFDRQPLTKYLPPQIKYGGLINFAAIKGGVPYSTHIISNRRPFPIV